MRSLSRIMFAAGLHPPARRLAAGVLTVGIVGAIACGLATSGALASEPQVQVTYEGSFILEETQHPKGKPEVAYDVDLNWTATGVTTGVAEPQPLTFTSLAGKEVETPTSIECGGSVESGRSEGSFSIDINPVPGDWSVTENASPSPPGWTYEISDTPRELPVVNTLTTGIGTGCQNTTEQSSSLEARRLFAGESAPHSEAQLAALLEPLAMNPGGEGSQTRTFTETWKPAEGAEATVAIVLKTRASTPPASTTTSTSTQSTSTPASSVTTSPKQISEQRRTELEQQARADVGPALASAWAAHGLSALLAASGGGGRAAAARAIAGPAAGIEANEATVRAIDDERTVSDPPAPEYDLLAQPTAAKAPALPSCQRFHGSAGSYCKRLHSAETALLLQGGDVAAIDDTLSTTIDRDTAAIAAHDHVAAATQASHFVTLHSQFETALAAQGTDGAKVASLLNTAHVKGTLTRKQSATAIKWLEAQLAKHGIATAQISSTAGSALTARKVNALDTLAHPTG